MQLPFGFAVPQVDWKPPVISELPRWSDYKRVCYDVETKDPELQDSPGVKGMGPGDFRPGNHIVGVGFALEDGPSYYLPIRHESGDNLNVDHVLAYVRDQAKSFSGTVVGANLAYDLGFSRRDRIYFDESRAKFRDVINAAVLINELQMSYSLDAILKREGLPGKDEDELKEFAKGYKIHPKREMYKLPGRAVARYALQDVNAPLALLRRQEKQIDEAGIQKIWDMETDVLPILVRMRERGVRVDLDKVDQIERWAIGQATERLAFVKSATGCEVGFHDVWKSEVMARPLLTLGIKVPLNEPNKKGDQSHSITGDFLEKCGEVGVALGRARDYNKLVTTFCARTKRYAINGRIHAVIHQLRNTKDDGDTKGARYGRFSSEHYNIQQEPARDDEFGDMWRSVYVPDDGKFWVCSDWSQQEPRIAVHYAELLGLPGAKEFAERYRRDPSLDCHQMLADLTGIVRKIVKNYFNGAIYGMGDGKLCRAIGHPTQLSSRNGKVFEAPGPTGKVIIDKFRAMVPWVSGLTREASRRAEAVGMVWTTGGRRCNFEKGPDGKYMFTHKAFSRIGQGSAADQMKLTLIAADRAGIPIQLIVHDEFDYSCSDLRQARELRELQMNTMKFNVPMLVDCEIGPNWGTLTKLSKLDKEGRTDAFMKELGFPVVA
jgi:DNA polymerase I-like protein with 3'-5' exonuclease and polymerase domains